MCWQKIKDFFNPPPDPNQRHYALSFAINDYPGTGSDLNGCLNDQLDFSNKLLAEFPAFIIQTYSDEQVTRYQFLSAVERAIDNLPEGAILVIQYSGHGTQVRDTSGDEVDGYDEALYLHDGVLVDDEFHALLLNIPANALVVVLLDSCFSGTATKAAGIRPRFMPPTERPSSMKVLNAFAKSSDMNWIVVSGCDENEYSMDATFNGRPNGAFTYYALKTLQPGITYQQWFDAIRDYLPSTHFNQSPTLEGPENLLNQRVFEV